MSIVSNSRAEKIQSILDSRKPIAEKTGKTITHLSSIEKTLRDFQEFLPKIQDRIDEGTRTTLQDSLQTFLGNDSSIQKCLAELTQLQARFSRSTLNIGVAGNARQGKSTALQGLTGLSSDEIPSASEGHCTGAPSMIINNSTPENPSPKTYAVIEFYTENEFMNDVIHPYYDTLGLTPKPRTFDEFISLPLPHVGKKYNATEEELYKKLRDRQNRQHLYRKFLGQSTKEIVQTQIREFVAQQDKNGSPFATWIAVKMATIYCPFRVTEVGKVSVCDTPGLGDFVCGAEDNLVHNIGNNIDAVLMVKRVPLGSIVVPADTYLYDLIPKAISEFPACDWTHFIINKSKDDTAESVAFFHAALEKSAIKTRRTVVVDCKQPNEIVTVFDQILDDIADNQEALDEKLYKSRFENVKNLIHEIETFVKTAKEMISNSIPPEVNAGVLSKWFDESWKRMTEGIENIAKERRKLCGETTNSVSVGASVLSFQGDRVTTSTSTLPDGRGQIKVTVTPSKNPSPNPWETPPNGRLGDSSPSVPAIKVDPVHSSTDEATKGFVQKLEQIKQNLLKLNLFPDVKPDDWAATGLEAFMLARRQELLAKFSIAFDELDDGLVADCAEIRRKIWKVLINEKRGKLGRVIGEEYQSNADAWLKELAKYWEGLEGGDRIQRALNRLLDATISFRGVLLPKIRESITLLHGNGTPDADAGLWIKSLELYYFFRGKDTDWETVYRKLKNAWKKSVEDCCDNLLNIARDLELAKLAVIEDFCDNFIRPYGYDKSKEHWRIFYYQHQSDIWSQELDQIKANKQLYDEGNYLIIIIQNEIYQLNKLNNIQAIVHG